MPFELIYWLPFLYSDSASQFLIKNSLSTNCLQFFPVSFSAKSSLRKKFQRFIITAIFPHFFPIFFPQSNFNKSIAETHCFHYSTHFLSSNALYCLTRELLLSLFLWYKGMTLPVMFLMSVQRCHIIGLISHWYHSSFRI